MQTESYRLEISGVLEELDKNYYDKSLELMANAVAHSVGFKNQVYPFNTCC